MIFKTLFCRVLIVFILTINVGVFVSQNNRTINYQAVAHSTNGTGNTMNNTAVDVDISISSDTINSPEFIETHNVTTNGYGLFSLKIGSVNSGDFENIEWAEEDLYLGVAIDGEFMGYQLLVAVPYSFSSIEALNAETVNDNTVESNVPMNAVFTDNQSISIDSDSLYIENGNAIALNNIISADNDWTISTNDMYSSNSGKVGIGITNFNTNLGKLNITTDANSKRGLYIINNTSGNATNFGKFGVYAMVSGGGTGDNQGGWFDANGQGTGINIGVGGLASGNAGENRGVYGSAQSGTSNWAGYFDSGDVKIKNKLVIGENFNPGGFQLIDGNQGAGRILKSDAQGNAQWVQIGSLGVGVMLKNVYDSNNNSIVDYAENAQLTNGFQVNSNVPSGASFTDNQTLSFTSDSLIISNGNAIAINDISSNPNLSLDDLSDGFKDDVFNNLFISSNYSSLLSGSTSRNTGIGNNTLQNVSTGNANTAIGYNSLNDNSIGNYNVAIGVNALSHSINDAQTAVGGYALSDNTTGYQNNAYGYYALKSNTTGNQNNAFGYNALNNNSTGSSNTAMGHWSLNNNTNGNSNTAIGKSALYSNITGHVNTAVGVDALQSNLHGVGNTAVGYIALQANTTGNENTAIGQNNLTNNLTGGQNTSIGSGAMSANTLGSANVAVGLNSMYKSVDGASNTAVGWGSLFENINGSSNTAIGELALENNLGSENTAIGELAGADQTSSNQNTFVGYNSNVATANLQLSINNSTALGANTVLVQSNSVILGHNADVGIGTSSPTTKLHVSNASSTLVTVENTGNSGDSRIMFKFDGDDKGSVGYTSFNNTMYISTMGNDDISFGTLNMNNQIMKLKHATGNVGIGTVDPDEKLHLGSGTLKIGTGSNSYKFPETDGNLNQVLTTDGSGNVTWENGNNNLKELYISAHDFHTAEEISYPHNPNQPGGYPRHVVVLGNNGGTSEGFVAYDFPKPTDWTGSNMVVTVYYSGEKNDGNFNFNLSCTSYAIGQGGYNSPATSDILSVTQKYTLYKFTKTMNLVGYNSNHELLSLIISRYDFQNQSQGNPDSNTGLMYVHAIKITYPTN